jgi:hypothetical protein
MALFYNNTALLRRTLPTLQHSQCKAYTHLQTGLMPSTHLFSGMNLKRDLSGGMQDLGMRRTPNILPIRV